MFMRYLPRHLHRTAVKLTYNNVVNNGIKHSHLQYKNFIRQHTSLNHINYKTTKNESQPLGKIEGKLFLSYKCKVCSTNNSHYISKVAYEKGVVIVTCIGCNNNHLIADNLNWFTDLNGKRNIEEILAEKGEHLKKIDIERSIEAIKMEDVKQ